MTSPIPQPPAIPFLGNVHNIDNELPNRSFQLLAEQYGEIYQLNMLGAFNFVASIVKCCLLIRGYRGDYDSGYFA